MQLDLSQTVDALRAAGEQTRMRILALLREGDLAVGELVQILSLSQPRLSHHLKVLSAAGLVERLPEGAWVFYRATSQGAASRFLDQLFQTLDTSDADLLRDREALESIREDRAAAASSYFAQMADTWDTVRALHYPNDAIESAVIERVGQGPFDQVIDIGTGTGRMLTLLAPFARRAEGIDLSHQMLTVARANLDASGVTNARVRKGDAAATPFPDASADLVIVHQVLHYVDAPKRVLAEAGRLLRPGGRLVVVDFAPHGLEFLRDKHGHRRLGIRHDAMVDWSDAAGLVLEAPHRFDPPDENGLAVLIWSAHKPRRDTEVAA